LKARKLFLVRHLRRRSRKDFRAEKMFRWGEIWPGYSGKKSLQVAINRQGLTPETPPRPGNCALPHIGTWLIPDEIRL
jgi:hypothetical protein